MILIFLTYILTTHALSKLVCEISKINPFRNTLWFILESINFINTWFSSIVISQVPFTSS